MKKSKEISGNTLAAQYAFDKEMIARGVLLGRVDSYLDKYAEDDILVMGFSIRVPQDIGDEYLLTIRAIVADEAKVAFHAAATFEELIVGLSKRLQNRSLRWKDDRYG